MPAIEDQIAALCAAALIDGDSSESVVPKGGLAVAVVRQIVEQVLPQIAEKPSVPPASNPDAATPRLVPQPRA